MRLVSKRISLIIFSTILVSVFTLSTYFIYFIKDYSYVGIRAKYQDNTWIVKRVFANGIANEFGITEGMEIIDIDGKPLSSNEILNKWLVVEHINSIGILEKGSYQQINFKSNMSNKKVLILIFIMLVLILNVIYFIARKGIYSRKTLNFYVFCIVFCYCVLCIVPSSMGNMLGRQILIGTLSILPILFFYILLYFVNALKNKCMILIKGVLYVFAFINILLCVLNTITNLPYLAKEYLSLIPIYFCVFFCLISSIGYSFFCFVTRINKLTCGRKLCLLVSTSFLPLLIFYMLPLKYKVPFEVLLLFLINIIITIIYMLRVTKSIMIQVNISKTISIITVALYLAFLFVMLVYIREYIPLSLVILMAFLFYYIAAVMVYDFFTFLSFNKKEIEDINMFYAQEKERENISNYIHDEIIQDITYYSLKLMNERDYINRKQVMNVLDDVIDTLRELCSYIYPIMIEEVGLIQTISKLIEEFMKKYIVNINFIVCKFDEEKFNMEEKNFIFRAIRELINNSIKHGKSRNINVNIYEVEEYVIFKVKDDGKYVVGGEDNIKHFGLNSISEKTTMLDGIIEINIEDGTEIKIKLPRGWVS